MHKKRNQPAQGKISPGFRGRVWIDGKEGTFLGYGRIILLEKIREHGSITKAAKSMEMSYRNAWELVDSMNSQSSRPLVESATGGKGGGGAILTVEGEKAIKLFWEFHEDFQNFLKHEEQKLMLSKSTQQRKTKNKRK